jgi:hypothetical protein
MLTPRSTRVRVSSTNCIRSMIALATFVLSFSSAYWVLSQSNAGVRNEAILETHFVGRNEQV